MLQSKGWLAALVGIHSTPFAGDSRVLSLDELVGLQAVSSPWQYWLPNIAPILHGIPITIDERKLTFWEGVEKGPEKKRKRNEQVKYEMPDLANGKLKAMTYLPDPANKADDDLLPLHRLATPVLGLRRRYYSDSSLFILEFRHY
jgi:hypothetical protein